MAIVQADPSMFRDETVYQVYSNALSESEAIAEISQWAAEHGLKREDTYSPAVMNSIEHGRVWHNRCY